jgi:hypothetical protein
MAFTPDLPFPKSAGDAIKSKDWNDLVNETKRLDTAKVERAGDAITGGLSVAGALAVGKALAAATAKLDVAGSLSINDNTLYLRGGTDTNHGLAWFGGSKTFAGVAPDGPVLWGNAGGALGSSTGGVQKLALAWDGNGNVVIGVPSTTLKVDIGDRIRLRQGPGGTAGLWLYQTGPAEDRAFIGMAGDNTVGLFGNKGASWSLSTDVATGVTGVRTLPTSTVGLYVNAGASGSAAAVYYGAFIYGATGYGLYVQGRTYDQSLRTSVRTSNSINTTSTSFVDMPNMSLSVVVPTNLSRYFQILVMVNGVQAQGSNTIGGWFRLLVDGGQQDITRHEFNNNGWELRGVNLGCIISLGAGTHTISVQWATTSGTLTCCWYGDSRQIMVVEL